MRDKLLLRFVSAAQPITIAQAATAVAMSVPMARRRLRVLRDLGLVHVHLPEGLNGQNRYTLTAQGALVLTTTFGEGTYRARGGIERVNLPHHDGQVHLLGSLQLACTRSRTWDLDRFLFEGDVRRALPKAGLVPDAVALLAAGTVRAGVAFEVDLGSESPSWFAKKALLYAELSSRGAPLLGASTWRVAVTVPTARRRNRLALALWEADIPEGLVVIAVAGEVSDRTVLTREPWLTPRVLQERGIARARLVPEGVLPTVPTDRSHRENAPGAREARRGADLFVARDAAFDSAERS
ncbi:MAG: replication-relaxation family protein [Planctomycetes bacterium]|nr:replication-relaxation family protein [Planctomycetota bacterium]